MADDSTQKWLGRNRPPRVQITYDLETRGAIQKVELPLVVGILADLAGELEEKETLTDLKNRKFVEIDRDNFNDVMRKIKPRLEVTVEGKDQATGQPSKIKQTINFETVDDFTPDRLVEKHPALNQVLIIRQRLTDLVGQLDGKPDQIGILTREKKKIEQQIKDNAAAVTTQSPAAKAAADTAAAAAQALKAETSATNAATKAKAAVTDTTANDSAKELAGTALTDATELSRLATVAQASVKAAADAKALVEAAVTAANSSASVAQEAVGTAKAVVDAKDDAAKRDTAAAAAVTKAGEAKTKAEAAATAAKAAGDQS